MSVNLVFERLHPTIFTFLLNTKEDLESKEEKYNNCWNHVLWTGLSSRYKKEITTTINQIIRKSKYYEQVI